MHAMRYSNHEFGDQIGQSKVGDFLKTAMKNA